MLAFAGNADPRTVADPRGNPHIDRARLSVVLEGEPTRRAGIGVLKSKLELVLDVTTLPRAAAARAPRAGSGVVACCPSKERVKEIRERIGITESLPHFLGGHRAESAARLATTVHIPLAALGPGAPRPAPPGARLFVHPPVGARLVG